MRSLTRTCLALTIGSWLGLAIGAGDELAGGIRVRLLAPGVRVHTTSGEGQYAGIEANGLLLTTGEFSLLVDTGWSPTQTRELMRWAADTLERPIEHVVVTHAHADRAGGLSAFDPGTAIVQGHALTAQLLEASSRGLDWSFEFNEQLDLDGEKVVLFYPGHAHAADNVVVWLPRSRVLFAGCLVRPLAATDLGAIGEADTRGWELAMRRVIGRFREVEIVVPGHGLPGGPELLSHTMSLLERHHAAGQPVRAR